MGHSGWGFGLCLWGVCVIKFYFYLGFFFDIVLLLEGCGRDECWNVRSILGFLAVLYLKGMRLSYVR